MEKTDIWCYLGVVCFYFLFSFLEREELGEFGGVWFWNCGMACRTGVLEELRRDGNGAY